MTPASLYAGITSNTSARSAQAFRAILVDDGSRDRTYELMLDGAAKDSRIRAVRLSRNFGHQIALTAGVDLADGDAVIVMDADLQDPPEIVLEYER